MIESTCNKQIEGKIKMLLSQNQAKSIATLGVFAGNKKEIPNLQQIKIIQSQAGIRAYATDRYSIAEFKGTATDWEEEEILIPLEALPFLKSAIGDVRITKIDDRTIKLETETQAREQTTFIGLFPPIENFVAELDNDQMIPLTDPIALDLTFLVKASKLGSENDSKRGQKPVFKFYTKGNTERGKPKPVVLKRGGLTVVIQPTLASVI